MSPLSMIAWRFILAGIIMLMILFVKERPTWESIRNNFWVFVLLGFVGIFGMNALLFIGLKDTTAVNASLMMAINPIVTVLLSIFILKEGIRLSQGIGMVVSLLGVVLVLTGGSLDKLGTVSIGDLLVLSGNVCWALYGVIGKRYIKNSTPLATSTITMVIGALCLIPFANTGYEPMHGSVALEASSAIVFMALFGSMLSYLWWNRGITQIGANRTSIFFNIVLAATMVIAYFSGQSISVSQLCGAALVIFGVSLTSLKTQKIFKKSPFVKAI